MGSAEGSGESWPFVRTMLALDEVDSTSDRASEVVRRGGIPLPLCVWARRQTRGRGRGAHTWWSDDGSLTFTLAIDPREHGVPSEAEPTLALATAVAVIDALIATGFDAPTLGVRWPNDIQVGGLKLGGILPERVETPDGHRILIGVGLNVATDAGAMPADVRRMATSLSAIGGHPLDGSMLPRLLAAVLDRMGSVLVRLVEKDPDLAAQFGVLDLLRGERVTVDLGARVVVGRAFGIDEGGALILVDDLGARHRLIGGQVLR